MTRPRGLRQTRLAEASGLHRGGAARPRPPQRLRPSTIELGRGCTLLAPPRSPGGRRGEAPAAPARPPRPLPPAALPGPSARYGGWAGPAPALRRGVSRPPTARAAARASRAGAPASHAPRVTHHIMTKGSRHVGAAAPPSGSERPLEESRYLRRHLPGPSPPGPLLSPPSPGLAQSGVPAVPPRLSPAAAQDRSWELVGTHDDKNARKKCCDIYRGVCILRYPMRARLTGFSGSGAAGTAEHPP